MKINDFSILFERIKGKKKKHLVVANAVDLHTIDAVSEAVYKDFVSLTLTGNKDTIFKNCKKIGFKSSQYSILHCETEDFAISTAVEMAHKGSADMIMKGLVNTDSFMRAILNKEKGLLPPDTLLTHVTMLINKVYHKPLFISDVAIIPNPTLEQKKQITNYLIQVANQFGIIKPKVAFIAASEKVLKSMLACTDAIQLKQLWEAGYFSDSICDGPMGLDLAIDLDSAKIKGFNSPVAGDADCLLFPNIESGNVFYKTNTKFCNAEVGAIVMGTKVPTILSSRGDTTKTKLNSIAMAAMISV